MVSNLTMSEGGVMLGGSALLILSWSPLSST